jgi:PilZ domain-containing protein
MEDHRQHPRKTVNVRGTIRYGAASHEVLCTVTDLTPSGAGLSVGSTFGVPQIFQLAIDGDAKIRHCRVIWAKDKKLGVSFV